MKLQKLYGSENLLFYEEIVCYVLNVFENSVLARIFGCGHEIFIGVSSFLVLGVCRPLITTVVMSAT